MKTSIFKSVAMTLLFLVSLTANSQKAETPDYRYDVGAKINEMTITDGGTLVVATNDGLVGIKPGQTELLFNFTDYGRVKPEELTFVPGAPYVLVGQTGFGNLSTKRAVIDYMSGKKLFSTEDNGFKAVTSCDVMMPQNKLVVSGQRRASEKYVQALVIYDLDSGEQVSFIKFKGSEVVNGRPFLLENAVVVPTSKGLLKVDLATGNELWKNDLRNVGWMANGGEEKEFYANGKSSKIYKVNAGTGQLMWEDEKKVRGSIANFEILPQGLAVVSNVDNSGKKGLAKLAGGRSESKIAFLSTTNGDDLWEKAPKTKGYVQHFYIMEDGILFGIYEGGINKISFDGNTLFKRPLKTGENILTMAETPQGLIYITSEDANIVNLDTGDQVWKKPLKYKRADAISSDYDSKNGRYLISADDELFAVDENTGDVVTLAESKFEGKEDPTGVEVRDDGILLTSDQNMMMLGWEGTKDWHEYRRAPGKSAFGAILAGVTALASATASMAAGMEANRERNYLGQYTYRGARFKNMSNSLAGVSGASIAEMLKRFNATAATENAQFVLTKLEDGVGLVKLNKDTGAMEKEIVLKDKKPEYQVDDFGGILYYKPNDKSIFAYDLNK